MNDIMQKLAMLEMLAHIERSEEEIENLRDAMAFTLTKLMLGTVGVGEKVTITNSKDQCRGFILVTTVHGDDLTLVVLPNPNGGEPLRAVSKECDCPACRGMQEVVKQAESQGVVRH